MKVLQINAVYGEGSTGRMTMELHKYMLHQGIDSYVACSKGIDPLDSRQICIGNPLDVKFHSLAARLTGLQGYCSKRTTIELLKKIDELRPDIVQLGNLHSNFVNVRMLLDYLGEQDIATIIVLHDCWFYTGKCSHYTADNCFKWKTTCGNCPRLKKDIPSWYFDRTQKMLDDKRNSYGGLKKLAVVGVSNWITEEAKESILKDSAIIKRVYNWIDTNIFKPKEINQNLITRLKCKGKRILLGVAVGWSDDKGLSDFIRLADMLSSDYEIILVGEEIENREIPDNIKIVGRTKNVDELVDYYNIADCFLSLSTEESFGKVVAEALACGTPAIVYNSTASPELVGEKCGYIVNSHDFYELVNCVNEVCRKGKKYYSNECRKFACANFDKRTNIEQYLEIFREIGRI